MSLKEITTHQIKIQSIYTSKTEEKRNPRPTSMRQNTLQTTNRIIIGKTIQVVMNVIQRICKKRGGYILNREQFQTKDVRDREMP